MVIFDGDLLLGGGGHQKMKQLEEESQGFLISELSVEIYADGIRRL